MNRMRNSNFLISQELAALVLFSLVPEVMRNCGDGKQSQEQKAFREPDVTVLPGQRGCAVQGCIPPRHFWLPPCSAFLLLCWAICCICSGVVKSNTVLSSPTVRPQPPFNLTAVFTEGYNISWETIHQNPLFYLLNGELEYQLRYKRRADTWEVSEMLVYRQVPAKRGPAQAGQEHWCGRRALEVLKKFLFLARTKNKQDYKKN